MKTLGKVVICAIAYMVGVILTWMLVGALHLPAPKPIEGTTPGGILTGMAIGTLLLVGGLAPLAMGLGGTRLHRAVALFLLVFVAIGVNTIIEASVFTNFVTIGVPWMCAHSVLPCLFLAVGLVLFFGSSKPGMGFAALSAPQWAWRLLVAWIAFPVIYFVFGMCVAPFVMYAYRAGIAGLTIPAMPVLLKTVFLRSALFLVSSVPILALWTGSRRNLFIAFGIAESVMVGITGLVEASFFPMTLRIAHSIEITFDSFAYVGGLVLLFTARKQPVGALSGTPAGTPDMVVHV